MAAELIIPTPDLFVATDRDFDPESYYVGRAIDPLIPSVPGFFSSYASEWPMVTVHARNQKNGRGHTVNFLFDTGAGATIINGRDAEALSISYRTTTGNKTLGTGDFRMDSRPAKLRFSFIGTFLSGDETRVRQALLQSSVNVLVPDTTFNEELPSLMGRNLIQLFEWSMAHGSLLLNVRPASSRRFTANAISRKNY
ncbi:MAG: retroviral-like aspartic protease family protein [Candidatus Curtissbacteria bacterium]|nr:retroviral-like aspartic protease family protein [Candidatus Curtissbacteria bacterium]